MPTRQRPDVPADVPELSTPAVHARPDDRGVTRNDLLLAAALALVSIVVAALSIKAGLITRSLFWLPIIASIALAAPLAVRRRWPVPAMLVQVAVYIASAELGALEFYASQVSLFVGMYAVGAWEPNRKLALGSRLLVVLVMAGWFTSTTVRLLDDPQVVADRGGFLAYIGIQVAVNIAFFAGAWILGDRAWRAAIARTELNRAQLAITAQQEQLAEQAVSLERVRIARELHDVVAHHVSAMGVQAGAARRVLTSNPDRAADALRTVEQSAREAIGELRTMVSALRSDSGVDDGPPPTLDALPALLESARSTGQQVELTTVGEPRALSPVAGLTVYRVVQEALTNARKHAGPTAQVDVRLRYEPDVVEIEIADDGRNAGLVAPGIAAGPGIGGSDVAGGLGLVGMRERVSALGGNLEVGPRSRGGWLVRATIPVPRGETNRSGKTASDAPVGTTADENAVDTNPSEATASAIAADRPANKKTPDVPLVDGERAELR